MFSVALQQFLDVCVCVCGMLSCMCVNWNLVHSNSLFNDV